MSTEGGGGNTSSERSEEGVGAESVAPTPQKQNVKSEEVSPPSDQGTEPSTPGDDIPGRATGNLRQQGSKESASIEESEKGELKPSAKGSSSTPVEISTDSEAKPRQVIAVSASKGPAAFFNLARKFLVTDEMCDLSALEGAIVSAVDAAHLLERSKLATIVGVQTAYVTVEPKKKKPQTKALEGADKKEQSHSSQTQSTVPFAAPVPGQGPAYAKASAPLTEPAGVAPQAEKETPLQGEVTWKSKGSKGGSGGRELRRARIVITVRRTPEYKKWLDENPLQAIIAADVDEEVNTDTRKQDTLPS
mmetsp:Transcript_29220/g.41111  ORF Transcript_29220/g.41111 Transcript_29220/m.41111 type:complete len:305 (+) Transcript_29220:257-1171(+)